MNIVFFTGAGISKESGIPTYRGKEGLFENNNDVEKYHSISYFYEHPDECWEYFEEFLKLKSACKPNKAHELIASITDSVVITQNIDSYHQKAGSKNVIELHGSYETSTCMDCGETQKISSLCRKCAGWTKPDVIFFGEELPMGAYEKAEEAASNADIFVMVGTSGNVYPAAYLPALAKRSGAKIYEINPARSEYSENLVDKKIEKPATEGMEEIMKRLKDKYEL